MKKYAVLGIAGLAAAGVGMGAGIAAAMLVLTKRAPTLPIATSVPTSESTAVDTSSSLSLCQFNALSSVSDSLNRVRAINAFADNPLPAIASLSGNITPDLLASLNPAPFPQISDRAQQARVPIIMYHDVTPVKDVDYDVTPQELEDHFKAIQEQGLTPITLDQLVAHLRTGVSLPEKPIVLTFDDNYIGQYKHAFPLLKKFNYPAVWSVHVGYVGKAGQKPKANWQQIKEMRDSGLITIASHTINHLNLSQLNEKQLDRELKESKRILEKELGIPIRYFTYPEGTYDPSIKEKVAEAGYEAALTMSLDRYEERPANKSEDLLAIMRYGQSRFAETLPLAWGGNQMDTADLFPPAGAAPVTFSAPVRKREVTVNNLPLTLVYGGRPVTVHADTRAQVKDIAQQTDAVAAVDGGFFSLESLTGNQMIGPVLSQFSKEAGIFNPGRVGENPLLKGRPLVLIGPKDIKFIPYDPSIHAGLESLQAIVPDVTDAFVAAGWLVRDGKPQPAASFGKLYGFDAHRDRAFWGIDRAGRPVIGVTMEMIDSVGLGQILAKAGLYDVVMLDSGASASLTYRGKSVMSYEPRPVPHIVALLPPVPQAVETSGQAATLSCPVSFNSP